MDAANEFFILLPSDDKQAKKLFPDNKTESYKVQLPYDLNLDGSWQVSLSQLIFPHTWYNFREDSHLTLLIGKDEKGRPHEKTHSLFKDQFHETTVLDECKVTLPKGSYSSVEQLGDKLESLIFKKMRRIDSLAKRNPRPGTYLELRYDPIQHKVNLRDIRNTVLLFSDDAGGHFEALGLKASEYTPAIPSDHADFDHWKSNFKDLKYYKINGIGRISEKAVFLNKNPVIFVYCDVIEPQIVGESQVKLLRTVSANGDFSETSCSDFFKYKYLPVRSGYIRTIEVELRDNKGQLINFQSGDVLVELHFRKCHLYK